MYKEFNYRCNMKNKTLNKHIMEGGNDILPKHEKPNKKTKIKKPKKMKEKDIYSLLEQFT